jgi:hypothetical protein
MLILACLLPWLYCKWSQQALLLHSCCGQLSKQEWGSYRLNTSTDNHAVRSKLGAALQAKDPNDARHSVAGFILVAAAKAQDMTPGSALLLQKSDLTPAADSAAARAAYAKLFRTVYSRVSSATSFCYSAVAVFVMRGIWVESADCGRLASAALDCASEPVYDYAVSQLHICAAASNPDMAALLLGPAALDDRCLR